MLKPIWDKIFNILCHRSMQVILLITLYISLGDLFSLKFNQGLYTASILIKDLLIWIIPLTVGVFIAYTIHSFKRKAPIFIGVLLAFEAFSNFSSVWYAYFCADLVATTLPSFEASSLNNTFSPLWRLPFVKPLWWSAQAGSLMGVIIGCIAAFMQNDLLSNSLEKAKEFMQWVLTHIFARLIPVFILGFVAQLYHTKLLEHILTNYALLVIWLVVFIVIYLVLLFTLGAGWSLYNILRHIRNVLPAGMIALVSSCSLSTMPWTIQCAAKNLDNPDLAKAIIPATTNIQQIGDCIMNTFLCFLIYRNFYGENPDLLTWFNFSVIFVIARFATAAIIGGAIFIMVPIYESSLSFNPEMIAIILAFNVILDPLVTSSNVIANGALCRVFERVWNYLVKNQENKHKNYDF